MMKFKCLFLSCWLKKFLIKNINLRKGHKNYVENYSKNNYNYFYKCRQKILVHFLFHFFRRSNKTNQNLQDEFNNPLQSGKQSNQGKARPYPLEKNIQTWWMNVETLTEVSLVVVNDYFFSFQNEICPPLLNDIGSWYLSCFLDIFTFIHYLNDRWSIGFNG